MRPFETFPGTNGPSNLTLNHSPNSRWSVSARQTRDTGAFNSIVFSIRLDICNYLVAFQYVRIWSICDRFVALASERPRSEEELARRRNGEWAKRRWWHTHGAAQNPRGCHIEQSRPRPAEI